MSTATRPAPPPRRRDGAPPSRAVDVPQRSTWATRLVVVLAVVTVLVALGYGATVSPFLDVDTLTVRGTARTTPEQVLDAGGIAEGDALYWIDTGAAESRIEAVPFVARAKVVREWPGTVRVAVTERVPAAWAEVPGGMVVVDRTGRVLERVDAPPAGLPQLAGLRAVPEPGARVVPAGPARIAGALPALAAGGTRSVTATDEGPTMQLVNGVEVRFGDTTRLGAKLRAMAAVFAAMEGEPLAYVDVSVATNPVAG